MLDLKTLLAKVLNAVKVDYVTQEGDSGAWHYRVWASGRKEAWLYASLGGVTLNKAIYRYYLSYTYATACPITISTIYTIQANAFSSTVSLRFENVGWSSNKLTGYFMSDSSENASSGTRAISGVNLFAYIVGK